MAVDMSRRLGWIDDSVVERALSILQQARLPTGPPDAMTVEKFKSIMAVSLLKLFPLISYPNLVTLINLFLKH